MFAAAGFGDRGNQRRPHEAVARGVERGSDPHRVREVRRALEIPGGRGVHRVNPGHRSHRGANLLDDPTEAGFLHERRLAAIEVAVREVGSQSLELEVG